MYVAKKRRMVQCFQKRIYCGGFISGALPAVTGLGLPSRKGVIKSAIRFSSISRRMANSTDCVLTVAYFGFERVHLGLLTFQILFNFLRDLLQFGSVALFDSDDAFREHGLIRIERAIPPQRIGDGFFGGQVFGG